MVERMGLKS